MLRLRRPLVPFLLIAALAATLLFAATAAAEVKVGEGTSPEQPGLKGEADLLTGSVEYDSTTSAATIHFTTREAPESTPLEKREYVSYLAALITTNITCDKDTLEAELTKAAAEERPLPISSVYEFIAANKPSEGPPAENVPPAEAYSIFGTGELAKGEIDPEEFVPASKAVGGGAVTLSGVNPKAANGLFNCALIETIAGEPDFMVFPLTAKTEPPPAQPDTTPSVQSAPPAKPTPPPPGVLSLAKAKPLKLAAGKWKTVKVTVTNTGGTVVPQGSLRLKAPKGVVVRPGRQKLPSLLPGDSWTVSARVKLTAKAKAKSTVRLAASSGGLTAGGALVLTRTG